MLSFKMLPTIQFDDQAGSVADKICDVWANGRLPPKARATHAVGA
jgi:hypothetical protein